MRLGDEKKHKYERKKKGVAHLEHLDVGHAEIKVGGVTQDEASAEENAYGEDRAHKHLLGEVDIFCAIEEACRPLQYARASCLFYKSYDIRYACQGTMRGCVRQIQGGK